ncbi:hypothetical protein AVEN_182134-1 [Araneus ventricosus]|uniref:Uncharacterized protein n=1 Tax=Araneus ventricosus TaxID=182803 RepID=A0A4Y2GQU2_ARAVE|nr:hypothetical protein AVEN_182134-1 [Araneus ventricosus]
MGIGYFTGATTADDRSHDFRSKHEKLTHSQEVVTPEWIAGFRMPRVSGQDGATHNGPAMQGSDSSQGRPQWIFFVVYGCDTAGVVNLYVSNPGL